MNKKKRILAILAIVLFTLCIGGVALATVGDCEDASSDHVDTDGVRPYKINYGSFCEHFPHYSNELILSMISQAADVWASEASSGFFEYAGSTTYESLMDISTCWANGRDYGIVVADESTGKYGTEWGDCCWFGQYDCEEFRIKLYYPAISSGDQFLKSTAHELGHAIDVGHPQNQEVAVMCSASEPCVLPAPLLPHLRQWDIKCAQSEGGDRELEARYKIQYADGTFSTYTPIIPGEFDIDKLGLGWNGVYNAAMIANDGSVAGGLWIFNLSGLGEIVLSTLTSTGIEAGWWPDYNTNLDFALYNNYADPSGMTDQDDGHFIHYAYSDFDFINSSRRWYGTLRTCDAMAPGYYHTCIGYNYARSWRRVSVTRFPGKPAHFLPYRPSVPVLTLTAWQNASAADGDREDIFVSVGRVSTATLPTPFSMLDGTGLSSFTAPSVACSPDGTGDYQCMVAFVPKYQEHLFVHVQKFDIQAVTGTNGVEYYRVVKDPAGPQATDVKSTSDPELWYNAGQWWLAIKWSNPGEYAYVYGSTNGLDYSFATNLSGDTVGGHSVAIDYDTGEALIGFVRY